MKIIITESQHNSVQTKLKDMIKKLGWEQTAKVVGGPENLVKVGFNSDPMEFLNAFNDLDVTKSQNDDWTLFQDKRLNNIMGYDQRNGYLYVDNSEIWTILKKYFGLTDPKIQKLLKRWVNKTYNLKGVIPLWSYLVR